MLIKLGTNAESIPKINHLRHRKNTNKQMLLKKRRKMPVELCDITFGRKIAGNC